ncbi:hypothetical protein EON79_14290, partial [bacterium]
MPEPFALAPARWIWLEPERAASAPILLFRREFDLAEIPEVSSGWVLASGYRLWINGRRVQSGPAPADPRHLEADPVNLKPFLQKGRNAIGIEVLSSDSEVTPVPERFPGFIMRVSVGEQELVTDAEEWWGRPDLARSSAGAGAAERFDSRLHPHGWNRPDFAIDAAWIRPQELDLGPERTPFSGWSRSFDLPEEDETDVSPRSVPPMREEIVRARALIGRGTVRWSGLSEDSPEEWLGAKREMLAYREARAEIDKIRLSESGGVVLTYELPFDIVGWPQATIDAPPGTVVEFAVREDRDPGTLWFDSPSTSCSRWISRGREEVVEPFAYEEFRYLQIRITNAVPGITIRAVGARRRESAFPGTPILLVSDPELQTLFEEATRAIVNSAQDLVVRESERDRVQSAGEGSHQLHPVRTLFGGVAVSRRFLSTFATGQTTSGLWLDVWPPRAQDEAGARPDDTTLDRSIGFVLDHYHHWMHSGDLSPVLEHWPRIERLLTYLRRESTRDGLLPVEGDGRGTVWMDGKAFRSQAEKRGALNLYLHHMLGAACEMALVVAPASLPDLQGWREWLGSAIEVAYFRAALGTYVANPTEFDRGEVPRFDDRSLAHHLLAVDPGAAPSALELLRADRPEVGRSEPINAVWTLWALARHGAIAEALDHLRAGWAEASPVPKMGAAASLILAHSGLLGLRPLTPGYAKYEIAPDLGDLE